MSSPCPVYGFEFRFRLDPAVSDEVSNAVWESFIDLVERHGLSAGGGGDVEWTHVITRVGSQATEADRQLLLAWAAGNRHVREAAAGDLVDVNEV